MWKHEIHALELHIEALMFGVWSNQFDSYLNE